MINKISDAALSFRFISFYSKLTFSGLKTPVNYGDKKDFKQAD